MEWYVGISAPMWKLKDDEHYGKEMIAGWTADKWHWAMEDNMRNMWCVEDEPGVGKNWEDDWKWLENVDPHEMKKRKWKICHQHVILEREEKNNTDGEKKMREKTESTPSDDQAVSNLMDTCERMHI